MAGLLGPRPQANTAFAPLQVSQPSQAWDQARLIASLNQLSFQNPRPWAMDSSVSTHMMTNDGILLSRQLPSHSSITVDNGASLHVTHRGSSTLHTDFSAFHLKNLLVVPSLTHNLLFVRQFTRDNHCSIEFDSFGFSVKDISLSWMANQSSGQTGHDPSRSQYCSLSWMANPSVGREECISSRTTGRNCLLSAASCFR
jgi:hypothetical protein